MTGYTTFKVWDHTIGVNPVNWFTKLFWRFIKISVIDETEAIIATINKETNLFALLPKEARNVKRNSF